MVSEKATNSESNEVWVANVDKFCYQSLKDDFLFLAFSLNAKLTLMKEAWHNCPCIPDGSGFCLELWLWHRLLISYPCMQTGVVECGWKSLDDITFGQFLKRSGSCSEPE